MKNWFQKTLSDNKAFLLFVVLMLIFRSALADWNTVPTGSMKPTILEGDRILVNKMAYDLRIPFTHTSIHKLADPVRGDIIVFDSKASEKRLVKRVIGVPGDIVEMRNNIVSINGDPLSYRHLASNSESIDTVEKLSAKEHVIRVHKTGSAFSSFSAVEVPADTYLALGDNRDNSADSRVIGFVPRDEIVGRTQKVVMSLDYENYFIPRKDRFLHAL